MALRAVCPGCRGVYNLDDWACGQSLRCKYCHQLFTVEAEPAVLEETGPAPLREAAPDALQTRPDAPRPRAAAVPLKRTPAPIKKSSSSAAWWIGGGVAAAVLLLLLVVGGIVVFAFLRVRETEEAEEAQRQARQSKLQAKQPLEKADDWNNKPKQNFPPVAPPADVGGVPPGGRIVPPAKPVEPPFEPIVVPQPAAPHLNVRPPVLIAERVIRTLPSTIGDVAVGGGGRFLVLYLPGDRKLAVFDVNAARVVKYLAFGDDIKFAAGMDKLLVALPEQKILQRWSLTTFERELSVPLAGEGKVLSLTMGSASNGPLLVQQGSEGLGDSPSLTFHDVRTMKPLAVKWSNNPGGSLDARVIRASANGKIFGLLGWGPVTLVWDDGRVKITHLLRGGGLYVLPGPDGKTVFTDSAIYTEFLKPAAGTANVKGAIPGVHGRYYLAGDAVYLLGDNRPLMTIPLDKPEKTPDGLPLRALNDPLPVDKRGYFIPDAKLLIHISPNNDQLVLRRLDIEAGLEKSGLDYLFVVSQPPVKAKQGATYRYQLAVKSKKGGVKYRLESGPKGMKVSGAGLLTWDVPADADGEVDVALSIGDRMGQEVFHTFRIVPGAEGEEQPSVVPNAPPGPVKPPVKPPEPEPEPEPIAPPSASAADIRPPKLDKDKVEVPLPSEVADVAVGGGGRYLVLHLPREHKLAVFDVNAAKLVGHVPLAEDKVLFTAGRTKLMVVLPGENLLQRWDLATLKREAATPLPARDKVSAAVMGSASNGPLLVASAQGVSRSELFFMDPRTLKRLPIGKSGKGHIHIQLGDGVRASADGRVFAIWRGSSSPQGIQTLVLEGREAKGYYEHNSAGHLFPGPDGKVIYTAGGRYTNQVKPLGDRRKDALYCFPAARGDYFLSVQGMGISPPHKNGRGTLAVHLAGDERPLATLPEVALPDSIEPWDRKPMDADKRIHFIPPAKLIVTIPDTNDRLVLHRFDVEAALEKSGVDYLLIASSPPAAAKKGTLYAYRMVVKSKKGGVASRLECGPPGMKLSPKGVLTWRVPADFAEGEADVLLAVTDASGQEVFQKFRIDYRE